jgi:type II secretory ATPase GspE/PulE/Tfp pilus assembly ATPase PilB-like protein
MDDLAKFLLSRGVVSKKQLLAVLSSETVVDEPLYYRLLREWPHLEEQLWESLAAFLHIKLVTADNITLDPLLEQLVPARLAHEYSIVPFSLAGSRLEIALADPRQFDKCEEFAMLLSNNAPGGKLPKDRLSVTGRLARPSDVALMIKTLYGIGAETVQDLLSEQPGGHPGTGYSEEKSVGLGYEEGFAAEITVIGQQASDSTGAGRQDQDTAIIDFVNSMLLEAVKNRASDIHLEPFEQELRIRYRIDGMLRTEPVPKKLKHLEAAIISRIKIMANLDIAEKRLAQDGQIRLQVTGRPIDVRVSVLPTMFGQGLALRLLDRQVAFINLDRLGMADDYLDLFHQILTLSHGVILVTGPTGSGKTTTLYSALTNMNWFDKKIITVEDPIEYQLEDITQIQIKPSIGLTFANVLKNILRHDPDVIMVGEIRDRSTAQIAISAAMTGHLVFSTLHTNDAPSAPIRLLEMGLEPYLVASALEAVIAQRLVRLLCTSCRKPASLTVSLSAQDRKWLSSATIYEAQGCPVCQQSGYSGRTAIFEMFTLNDKVRQLILDRSSAARIAEEAAAMGMRSLYQSGLDAVSQGIVSLAEIYRVARQETTDMKSYMRKDIEEI